MKATLSYNLPEEREDLEAAQNGMSYKCAINEFDQYLRSKIKYEEMPSETREIYDTIRTHLHECMGGLEY